MIFRAMVISCALTVAGCVGPGRTHAPWQPATMEGRNSKKNILITPIGRYTSQSGKAEIPAFDPATWRLFISGGGQDIEVANLADPTNPILLTTIDLSGLGHGANSVAIHDGILAAAISVMKPHLKQHDDGLVVFIDTTSLQILSQVTVGPLPDMLTFTPDGLNLLVANEGEPDEDLSSNPPGSISIIDMRPGPRDITQADVRTASFESFNIGEANQGLFDEQIRTVYPGATRAQDVEPEYITVAPDSATAWVALQEHNALAILDVAKAKITSVKHLGKKDHNISGNELDASDKDKGVNIRNWPVYGLYQPDGIAAYQASDGQTYIVTANEGDAASKTGFEEEVRIMDITLDPTEFPDATILQLEENLGRLQTTRTLGTSNVDKLHTFGGRSFSIFNAAGELLYDSGSNFARVIAAHRGDDFNSNGIPLTGDSRSDNKGCEPEGVVVGQVGPRQYAFIGLERDSSLMVYDISNPRHPEHVAYFHDSNDVAPEGLSFVPALNSPTGQALLIVSFEVSGTTRIFEISASP